MPVSLFPQNFCSYQKQRRKECLPLSKGLNWPVASLEAQKFRALLNKKGVFLQGLEMAVSESSNLLGQAFLDAIREAVKEAIREVGENGQQHGLLDPDELAAKLKVPVSWVYEQSRQGNIPTHRLGRYIRFDLAEVLASQKKKQPRHLTVLNY